MCFDGCVVQMSVLLGVVGLGLMGLGAGLGANLDPAEEQECSETGGAVGGEEGWRGQGAALAFEARYRRDMREWLDSLTSDEAQEEKGGRVRRRRQRAGGVWRGAVLNCVVVTLLAAGWALVLRTILLGTIPSQAATQAAAQALHEGMQVLEGAAEVVEPLVGLDKGAGLGGGGVVSWLPEGVLVGGAVGVAVQAVLQGRRAIAHMAHAHAGKRQQSRNPTEVGTRSQVGGQSPHQPLLGRQVLCGLVCLVQGRAAPMSRPRPPVTWARLGGTSRVGRARMRTGRVGGPPMGPTPRTDSGTVLLKTHRAQHTPTQKQIHRKHTHTYPITITGPQKWGCHVASREAGRLIDVLCSVCLYGGGVAGWRACGCVRCPGTSMWSRT